MKRNFMSIISPFSALTVIVFWFLTLTAGAMEYVYTSIDVPFFVRTAAIDINDGGQIGVRTRRDTWLSAQRGYLHHH